MVKECPSCEGFKKENICRSSGGTSANIGMCLKECSNCWGLGIVLSESDRYTNSLELKVAIEHMVKESKGEVDDDTSDIDAWLKQNEAEVIDKANDERYKESKGE